MEPEEYEGETQDPRCPEEGCDGVGSHRCVVRALREELLDCNGHVLRLTRERDEARADRLRYSDELTLRTTQLQRAEAKLAKVVEALENEPDPLEGAILALAAAKGE